MSDKSGASSQVISLPKGGGALHGIGETFSPDLFTGTGNFTIPIALPHGRNGFQPELSLSYSTGNGNSPYGLGWVLSIPGVSRKTSKGIPVYDDGEDVFVLSGAEDLVPVSEEAPGTTRYRPRTEGLFARILHHRDSQNDYWEAQSKDGLVSLYGIPEAAGDDPAAVADPADRNKVFAWKLTLTQDPFGNRIEYEYERDSDEDGPRHWDQLYLKQIRYADFIDGDETRFLVTVTFHYEDRPDPFSEYRSGFEIRTQKRCTSIELRTHADEERLVRTYRLIYLDQLDGMEDLLPLNGVSLLSQISVAGHDGEQTEELPPLEFSYTRFEPKGRDFFPLEGTDLPARSLNSQDMELADLFGNGLPDILQMNGAVRYWRNLGGGRFDLPRSMRDAPAGLTLADPGVQLIDADGDGRIDLLATVNGLSGYFPLNFNGAWDRRSFQRYDFAPSFNLEDPEVQLVDLDGDGVTDAVRSGSRMEYYFNDPQEGWNGARRVNRRALDEFPNVNFSDPRVRWGDMTGDGLQDILLVHDGAVEYWPSLGYGAWGRRVHMRNSPRFPFGYNPKRILIGDVDGDGLADLVYVDHCKVLLWINQGGNGWSDPIEIDGTPPVTDMDAVRLVDLLGTGISGVLWSADARAPGRDHMYFLDFTGGLKPYLLAEMDNHLGAVTRVEYAPSTQFYLADQQNPATRWQTPLPFPVQVVACVEVIDEISRGKLTTEYRYHDGYWDGAEREFRGFGMVEQLDTETFERYNAPGLHGDAAGFLGIDEAHFSPPTMTRTWFHQGPVGPEHGDWRELDYSDSYWDGDPALLLERPGLTALLAGAEMPRRDKRDALRALRGSVLRTELYALDGSDREDRPYTVTESIYDVREESHPASDDTDRKRIFFPHPVAQRTTQWERGDDPMTSFSFTGDYDGYGLPHTQTALAIPRGRDFHVSAAPGAPYLGTRTGAIFAQRDDDHRYIVDRVARTTTHEILNDGSPALFDLVDSIRNGTAALRVIGQTLTYYDGDAFTGLPLGQLGAFGAPVRSESLVLTEEILREAYRTGNPALDPPEIPPYLNPDAPPAWTEDYPQPFRDQLPTLAGYAFHAAAAGHARGYFATTTRRRYDFHDDPTTARGLHIALRDPLGHDTSITYDAFGLMPGAVTGPTGLTTEARYDYRVMQPDLVTDPNGNRTVFTFTPLGLLASASVMGKEGEAVGDTPEAPGKRLEYDFLAFEERRQPISARTIARERHVHDTDAPLPERDATIETVEYSDGFGRLLQTRTQAEDVFFGDLVFANNANLPVDQTQPGGAAVGQQIGSDAPPRVIVSGWQVYDNKGRVVEKYEPFYATGYVYAQPQEAQMGQRVTMFYDPRGQVIRTVNPDGSEQRVIYGAPDDLTNPGAFVPTSWEAYTYDANDNAGRTRPEEAQSYQAHWNTPASVLVDALGRAVESVERNGPDPNSDWFVTRSAYDIQGNLLSVIDALGRGAFRYVYDLAGNALRTDNIDAGLRRTVLDVIGNLVEQRDSKGALLLSGYDTLNRPIRLWARDGAGQPLTLRQRMIYGDSEDAGLSTAEARVDNLLGQLVAHYDEAGRLTASSYDFKGNLLEKTRQVIRDEVILSVFAAPLPGFQIEAFRVDWQPAAGATLDDRAGELLDSFPYTTTTAYDALNRVNRIRYPQDVEGERRELAPRYNRAGTLERVTLDDEVYVEHIAYNAKGQRTLIAYGNGVMTRYAYDPQTFRLARLRSERYTQPANHIYQPTGAPLQDLAYEYDLVGNITAIHDRKPDSGVPNTLLGTNALDRSFAYDPIYRLISATGREQDIDPTDFPWVDMVKTQDVTLTRAYTETYRYDPLDNMERLRHIANGGNFTRDFTTASGNNRLATMTVGGGDFDYTYDASGNLIRETTSRHFEWDHSNQMKVFRTQTEGAAPSVLAHYFYDASGQRVKKLARRQGGQIDISIYIDGIFEQHRRVQNTARQENTLHVMDDQQRIAMVRVGSAFPEDSTPVLKFHLGDHLGNSNVVVDMSGAFVNQEEYTPYGETSFGSFARKQYRLVGKERDEEHSLYYCKHRYYQCWTVRWLSCDPIYHLTKSRQTESVENSTADNHDSSIESELVSISLYSFVCNNPMRFTDQNGLAPSASEIAQNINSAATAIEATLAQHHGLLRGTAEAAIAEAQGLKFVDNQGKFIDHTKSLVQATESLVQNLGRIDNQLNRLKRIDKESARQLDNALRPLRRLVLDRLTKISETLKIIREVRILHSNRLLGIIYNTGQRTEGSLVSSLLNTSSLRLLPGRLANQFSIAMRQIRSLPITVKQATLEAGVAATSARIGLQRALASLSRTLVPAILRLGGFFAGISSSFVIGIFNPSLVKTPSRIAPEEAI